MAREGGRPPRSTERSERGPRPKAGAKPETPVVKKVRSEHGTRVARSITCSACGQRDTIHFAPRDPKRALCRKCAADLLGVEDPDTKVGTLTTFTCPQCKRQGTTDRRLVNPDDFTCADCMRGIETKQEDKTKSATRLSAKVVRVRRKDT